VVEKAKTSRWSASGPNREMMVFVDDRGYPERAEPVSVLAGPPAASGRLAPKPPAWTGGPTPHGRRTSAGSASA